MHEIAPYIAFPENMHTSIWFCPGGFCPQGGFVHREFCPAGYCPGGFIRGVLSGGFCPGGFVLESTT